MRCVSPGVPFSRILEGSIDDAMRGRLRTAVVSLLDAFGCSMLRWGLYNADPHAGNLLLQVCVALVETAAGAQTRTKSPCREVG